MATEIKREVKKTSEEPKTTVKKPTTMAKKTTEAAPKKESAKKAETAEKSSEKKIKTPVKRENATGLRIGAVCLWLLAIAMEVMAILTFTGKVELPIAIDVLYIAIFFIILDLVFLVIGSQLWKKANHKDPISEKNKLGFWLWNNMGMIVAAIAFIPLIIIVLNDKKADKKNKTIVAIVAAVALLIGGLTGYDWNPMSEEKAANAEAVLEGVDVFWTSGGQRYHLDQDCSALSNSASVFQGTVDEAIHSYGKDYLCKFCMKKSEIEGVENLVYGANAEIE